MEDIKHHMLALVNMNASRKLLVANLDLVVSFQEMVPEKLPFDMDTTMFMDPDHEDNAMASQIGEQFTMAKNMLRGFKNAMDKLQIQGNLDIQELTEDMDWTIRYLILDEDCELSDFPPSLHEHVKRVAQAIPSKEEG